MSTEEHNEQNKHKPEIFHTILKDPLPKGYSYLLKYFDIEAVFTKSTLEQIYLTVLFHAHQKYFKKDANAQLALGRWTILAAQYLPSSTSSHFGCKEHPKAIRFSHRIYALPYTTITEYGLTRGMLTGVISNFITPTFINTSERQKWSLEITLLIKKNALEVVTRANLSLKTEIISLGDLKWVEDKSQ